MYKIISVCISLYLTVFEILGLKLEKRGGGEKNSKNLSNFKRRLIIVYIELFNIYSKF